MKSLDEFNEMIDTDRNCRFRDKNYHHGNPGTALLDGLIGLPFIWMVISNYDLRLGKNSLFGYIVPRFNEVYQIKKCDYQKSDSGINQRTSDIKAKLNYRYLMNGEMDRVKLHGNNFDDIIN
jgi:hypothetical protein